jgi:putative membrane protein
VADGPISPEDRDFGDASRRTYFSEERTLLAWWRSGLAALAVALGVGRVVPAVSHVSKGPFVVLGLGYAVLGLSFVVYGTIRHDMVDRALAKGRFAPLDRRALFALCGLLLVLTIGTMVVMTFGD